MPILCDEPHLVVNSNSFLKGQCLKKECLDSNGYRTDFPLPLPWFYGEKNELTTGNYGGMQEPQLLIVVCRCQNECGCLIHCFKDTSHTHINWTAHN